MADSPSLYNSTNSPGWAAHEVATLRRSLMKFGVGNWDKICQYLPGKKKHQIADQTKSMLGQQRLDGVLLGPAHCPHVRSRGEWQTLPDCMWNRTP